MLVTFFRRKYVYIELKKKSIKEAKVARDIKSGSCKFSFPHQLKENIL